MPDLLLHVCCAPCALIPLEELSRSYNNIIAYYYNPNIHPEEEYEKRREVFVSHAALVGLEVVAPPYDHGEWERSVASFGGPYPLVEEGRNAVGQVSAGQEHAGQEPAGQIAAVQDASGQGARRRARCSACYALRFAALAQEAWGRGIPEIASTLSISPYQFTADINTELAAAAAKAGVIARCDDFRQLYPLSVQRSRALGMYRQNYCGCRYSQAEAACERDARKAARKQRDAERGAANKTGAASTAAGEAQGFAGKSAHEAGKEAACTRRTAAREASRQTDCERTSC